MVNKELPFTAHVKHLLRWPNDPEDLQRFRKHVEPLNIQAKIESELSAGKVSSLVLLNGDPQTVEFAMHMNKWPDSYPPLSINGSRYRDLLEQKLIPTYDTVLFIGAVEISEDDLNALFQLLKPKGRLFATANRTQNPQPEIKGYNLTLISPIPSNPNYGTGLPYQGIVMEKVA